MNDSTSLKVVKGLNTIARNLVRRSERRSANQNHHHVDNLTKTMKQNKIGLRENVTRKIKRLKNIVKSGKQISPCLLGALTLQEKCIVSEGKINKKTANYFDNICTESAIQKVIENWNPDPSTKHNLYEDDPDYYAKKKQRDEGRGVGWLSTINGCGQTIHNELLNASSIKDNRNNEREQKRRAKLTPEQRAAEDEKLQKFMDEYFSDKLIAEEEIILGGRRKKKKIKKKTRKRKRRKRKKKKTKKR